MRERWSRPPERRTVYDAAVERGLILKSRQYRRARAMREWVDAALRTACHRATCPRSVIETELGRQLQFPA
jgi:hypothetical protein